MGESFRPKPPKRYYAPPLKEDESTVMDVEDVSRSLQFSSLGSPRSNGYRTFSRGPEQRVQLKNWLMKCVEDFFILFSKIPEQFPQSSYWGHGDATGRGSGIGSIHGSKLARDPSAFAPSPYNPIVFNNTERIAVVNSLEEFGEFWQGYEFANNPSAAIALPIEQIFHKFFTVCGELLYYVYRLNQSLLPLPKDFVSQFNVLQFYWDFLDSLFVLAPAMCRTFFLNYVWMTFQTIEDDYFELQRLTSTSIDPLHPDRQTSRIKRWTASLFINDTGNKPQPRQVFEDYKMRSFFLRELIHYDQRVKDNVLFQSVIQLDGTLNAHHRFGVPERTRTDHEVNQTTFFQKAGSPSLDGPSMVDSMVEMNQTSTMIKPDLDTTPEPIHEADYTIIAGNLEKSVLGLMNVESHPTVKYPISNFRLRPAERDGNCQFHAIADQLNLREDNMQELFTHEKVRKGVCNWMRNYGPNFGAEVDLRNFVYGFDTWEDFVNNMEQNGTWGDSLTLHVAAQLYQKRIVVLAATGLMAEIEPWIPGKDFRRQTPSEAESKTLFLFFYMEFHYDSLERINRNPSRSNLTSPETAATASFSLSPSAPPLPRLSAAESNYRRDTSDVTRSPNNTNLIKDMKLIGLESVATRGQDDLIALDTALNESKKP